MLQYFAAEVDNNLQTSDCAIVLGEHQRRLGRSQNVLRLPGKRREMGQISLLVVLSLQWIQIRENGHGGVDETNGAEDVHGCGLHVLPGTATAGSPGARALRVHEVVGYSAVIQQSRNKKVTLVRGRHRDGFVCVGQVTQTVQRGSSYFEFRGGMCKPRPATRTCAERSIQ